MYRIPLPSKDGVELRTVLARSEGVALVLYDGRDGHELGRTAAAQRWDGEAVPFRLDSVDLTLYVRDGIIEDRSPKDYTRRACAPLVAGVEEVRRVTLSSEGLTRELVVAGDAVFTESAELQPPSGTVPGPLEALGSVAGTGLWIPGAIMGGSEWRDEMSLRVPPDPKLRLPCGAPFVSLTRVLPRAPFEVPAGKIDAWPTSEIVDICRQPNPPALAVFGYQRAFAPGRGPVRLAFTGSDAKTWEYFLVSSQVTGPSDAPFPLESGNSWVFEKRDPMGAVVGSPIEVRVSDVRVVAPQGE